MLIELHKNFGENVIYKFRNLFEVITRELSIIIWISMVLALILWSYTQNEHEIIKRSQIKMCEKLSITEEIELSENIYK